VPGRLELKPFTADFLADAGQLLAQRHAAHLAAEPLLPSAFAQSAVAEAAVRALYEADGSSGSVALVDGMVVGYLLGVPKTDPVWGPNVWVEAAGFAVRPAETIRDLYGLAAARWVDEGRTAHFALVPTLDPAGVDAWSRLAFGKQHMHAIREVPRAPFPLPDGLVVRRAHRGDIPSLAELELALPQHQELSPVFSASRLPTLDSVVKEWEDDFDDPEFAVFVAETGGVAVGSAVGCSIAKSSAHHALSRPDNAGFLGFAAVYPDKRGLGVGRALGGAVLWWAAESGYLSVVTDWRVTNLLSSRAWPRLGFRPTFIRMHRLIGY
jgi:GNAT superfamily N-acetyltransferase